MFKIEKKHHLRTSTKLSFIKGFEITKKFSCIAGSKILFFKFKRYLFLQSLINIGHFPVKNISCKEEESCDQQTITMQSTDRPIAMQRGEAFNQ